MTCTWDESLLLDPFIFLQGRNILGASNEGLLQRQQRKNICVVGIIVVEKYQEACPGFFLGCDPVEVSDSNCGCVVPLTPADHSAGTDSAPGGSAGGGERSDSLGTGRKNSLGQLASGLICFL